MNVSAKFASRRRAMRFLAAGGLAALSFPLASRVEAVSSDLASPSGSDALEVIHRRRSCRNFTGAPVPAQDLDKILAAAMQAPSAHDSRPWRFVVIRNPKITRQIVTLIPSLMYIEKASALLVNCMDKGVTPREIALMSMSCCAMNMLLAAEALHYGAVWIAIAHEEGGRSDIFRKILALPNNMEPFNMVAVGMPAVPIPPQDRFDPKRIHLDTWGK